MNGVIVIDKPAGFTSFDIVAKMRGICRQRKIGHCGTLDPNATGVLPILLGSATRAQDIIPDSDKEYTASLKLGVTTDTLDIWGTVLSENFPDVTIERLESVLENFRGEIFQIPPMYSAIQINGKRLYDLARHGLNVERKSRKINIFSLELLSFDEMNQTAQINVCCSKGTYIRSLIDDIGKMLGCGAVMTSLRRTAACGFRETQAISLEHAQCLADDGNIIEAIMPVEKLFESYLEIKVTDKQALRFSNGGALELSRTALSECTDKVIVRVKKKSGDFIGLGQTDPKSGELKIYKLFQKN